MEDEVVHPGEGVFVPFRELVPGGHLITVELPPLLGASSVREMSWVPNRHSQAPLLIPIRAAKDRVVGPGFTSCVRTSRVHVDSGPLPYRVPAFRSLP